MGKVTARDILFKATEAFESTSNVAGRFIARTELEEIERIGKGGILAAQETINSTKDYLWKFRC
jgi:hypothetical protein